MLLITHATLPDGREHQRVLIDDGRFVAIGPDLPTPEGAEVIDAQGWLLSPPFVDAHFHMDATLSLGLPRLNASGTLLEGIALWGELKPQLTQEALVERALQYCDWAVAKGLLAIRSHVDVCDERLLAVEALLHVRERVKPYLDLQLVAFPQDGVLRSPGALANLKRALDHGRRRGRRHPAFRTHDGRRRRKREASCASWRPSAACAWTCTATKATTR